MSAKKSNQKKIKKEDIFGLKSYTDGAEMWKFITSELDPLQTPMEFLNDNSFEKRIASDIIETWLSYKNMEISAEDFNYYLNLICQTDYLVGFNGILRYLNGEVKSSEMNPKNIIIFIKNWIEFTISKD